MAEPSHPKATATPWLRYMGLAGQFLAAIALGLWLGRIIDHKLSLVFPWFTLLLPLAVIVGMLVKLVRETAGNSQQNEFPPK